MRRPFKVTDEWNTSISYFIQWKAYYVNAYISRNLNNNLNINQKHFEMGLTYLVH